MDCSPDIKKNAGPTVDQALLRQRRTELGARASLPYTMRIQVVVFYKSTPTVNDADIHRNITNMANFFRPHNICFVLSDIEYIKDSAMADFNTDVPGPLLSYTRPSYLTIFVHTDLGAELNGTVYEIPSTYLSVTDDVVKSTYHNSTMTHEMGHCFGLYHTFQTSFGRENVPRNGDCKNCETSGDYLCDTQADVYSQINDVNTECVYTGTPIIYCGTEEYLYETNNIMSYGRRSCRTTFTNGQGGRARDFILTDSRLYSCIAPDILTVNNNVNYTGGVYSLTAKHLINVTSTSYIIAGAAKMRMSANRIRLGPGVALRPTLSGGIAAIKANAYCE
ncbi:MAG: hypothetical protein EOO03_01630 [Chitinophagaceae bacterium]|nr:MAG: hypothetical protein EOO03_01630 [Chitinophagaceae bacterium]